MRTECRGHEKINRLKDAVKLVQTKEEPETKGKNNGN
tara:strand:- start:643 stop:753 length:111 start_codon:yes stop_codon:yes gene_type:complete